MARPSTVRTTRVFLCARPLILCEPNDSFIPQPAQQLEEDFPAVAAYLEGLETAATGGDGATSVEMLEQPSQHAQNAASEDLTSSLLQSVQVVMQRAEAEGREASDEELRQIVSRAVLDGVVTGYGMSTEGVPERAERDGDDVKRSRTEGS